MLMHCLTKQHREAPSFTTHARAVGGADARRVGGHRHGPPLPDRKAALAVIQLRNPLRDGVRQDGQPEWQES